jgi:hypothetical protein
MDDHDTDDHAQRTLEQKALRNVRTLLDKKPNAYAACSSDLKREEGSCRTPNVVSPMACVDSPSSVATGNAPTQ